MLVPRVTHSLSRRPGLSLPGASLFLCFRRDLHWTASLHAAQSDIDAARKWLAELRGTSLPPNIGELSYSRSSGPGGQNVNKVNSKAQLRVPVDRLLSHVPILLHSGIKSSRYYAEKSGSLLIQSDDSRKQAQNKETCFRKLHELLLEIGRQTVPGETPPDQNARVKVLKRLENEARLKAKKQTSNKKSSRSKSLND